MRWRSQNRNVASLGEFGLMWSTMRWRHVQEACVQIDHATWFSHRLRDIPKSQKHLATPGTNHDWNHAWNKGKLSNFAHLQCPHNPPTSSKAPCRSCPFFVHKPHPPLWSLNPVRKAKEMHLDESFTLQVPVLELFCFWFPKIYVTVFCRFFHISGMFLSNSWGAKKLYRSGLLSMYLKVGT